MTNLDFSELIEETALFLQYAKGASFATDELFRIAERVAVAEVPLELFSAIDLGKNDEVQELDAMLRFWFGDFSQDGVWTLRETILTHTNPIRDELSRSLSPNVVSLLRIKSLPVDAVDFIRRSLGIRNAEQLKKACISSVLSKSGEFSTEEELDILEDVVKRLEIAERRDDLPFEFSKTQRIPEPSHVDDDVVFLANADALADAIIAALSTERKPSFAKTATDFVSKDSLVAARDQARGVLGKALRFFMSPNSETYQKMRREEAERERAQLERRAMEELETQNENAERQPLTVVKVGRVGRRCEAISQLDFLILTSTPDVAFERVKKEEFVKSVLDRKGNWLAVELSPTFFDMPYNKRPTPPMTIHFYAASEFVFGTKEVALTSSQTHWEELVRRAKSKGWTLTDCGLYSGPKRLSSRTVSRLYEKLGATAEIPVELREENVGWKWLDEGAPELVRLEDLHADLHMHTTYSDGLGDFDAMAVASQNLGRRYIAFTDHSKSAPAVSGLDDADCIRYWDAIDHFNENLRLAGSPLRVLKGIEVDILENGGLDLLDSTLARADWVVASIHTARDQSQDRIHSRYMTAFTNPYVDAIAHPTERLIGMEAPMKLDLDFLCENAKRYGKHLEVNSQPRRLDLGFKGLVLAKQYGVRVVISTDAHAPEQLEYLRFGVEQARRAGLTKRDVVNATPFDEFVELRKIMKARE